jgi:hypothetical protein
VRISNHQRTRINTNLALSLLFVRYYTPFSNQCGVSLVFVLAGGDFDDGISHVKATTADNFLFDPFYDADGNLLFTPACG